MLPAGDQDEVEQFHLIPVTSSQHQNVEGGNLLFLYLCLRAFLIY